MKLQLWHEARSKINYLKRYNILSIILIFNLIGVITAFIIYPFIPAVLNYNADNSDSKGVWFDLDYTKNFFICILIFMAVCTIILLLALKDMKGEGELKSISKGIKQVAEGLNKIVEGSSSELDENLSGISNDEIRNLVSAFNKVKELEKARIKLIEENRVRLAEKERLASLGAMIGGITHNLRSPIMSIAGTAEALKDLIKEYEQSIDDSRVTKEDHYEIAREMMTWVEKIKPYCSYMSEIISTVKGQVVQMNTSGVKSFILEDVLKRVDILMNYELKTFHCRMNKDIQADLSFEINGEINNLVQVLNNLIINAIHAYEGKEGIINLVVMKNENNVEFIIEDFGKGIPGEVQDKLFKEIITTKGKDGTGLGLYMSYSTIKEYFGGDMSFESEEGKRTVFHVTIPGSSSNGGGEIGGEEK